MRFASFLSGGFTTMAVMNSLERKQSKPTSVHWFSQSLVTGLAIGLVIVSVICSFIGLVISLFPYQDGTFVFIT